MADISMPLGRIEGLTPCGMVQSVRHLPAAPCLLPKIKHLLADGNSSIDDIVVLLRMDPALAAQVVKIGNSVYYGSGSACATVEEAVGRVGFNRVYELVAYAVASQVLIRPLTVYGLESEVYWQSSLACALSAETLAQASGHDAASAYTMGLLHAIGMVVIDEWALRARISVSFLPKRPGECPGALELSVLGFTQAEAGASLLEHWRFPPMICAAVRWQDVAGLKQGGVMSALLQTAKYISTLVCGAVPSPALPPASVLSAFSFDPILFPQLINEVAARLDQARPLLDIPEIPSTVGVSQKLRYPLPCP
jgi:HD-like signal output (HDOD) protein